MIFFLCTFCLVVLIHCTVARHMFAFSDLIKIGRTPKEGYNFWPFEQYGLISQIRWSMRCFSDILIRILRNHRKFWQKWENFWRLRNYYSFLPYKAKKSYRLPWFWCDAKSVLLIECISHALFSLFFLMKRSFFDAKIRL